MRVVSFIGIFVGSGKAPVKSGLCIHEIKQDNNVAAKQLVVSFRVHQNINRGLENAGFLARSLWKVFRSRAGCLVNSQAAFLRRENKFLLSNLKYREQYVTHPPHVVIINFLHTILMVQRIFLHYH